MVPDKKLYNPSLVNKLKTSNYHFITNSLFTKSWLVKWGINSEVIYPYLSQDFIDLDIDKLKKENIILSVGRIYSHLHSKKQSILIDLFNKLKQQNIMFKNFKLILAGGLKQEDKQYFNELETLIGKNPDILLKPNLSYSELLELYKKSKFYIQMTGYGIDENKNPELVEHLGITPLEAMASGCITFCYHSGGPKEIIKEGRTGFLFKSKEELIKKLVYNISDPGRQIRIKKLAKNYIRTNFSYELFKKRVKEVIL